jgi:hypothetical protein
MHMSHGVSVMPVRTESAGGIPRALLAVGALLCPWGCTGVGPRTVSRDRFDYTEAISDSWKQQMLVNMVKLRYGDTPVFLDVVSVINQYSVEAQADVRFNWVHPVASVGDSRSIGGAARYTDRPTITYMPLTGDRFARSLMKPLSPPALLSLIDAGYPIDVVLRVCTHSVNGVRNRYGGAVRAHPADPRFYALLEHLRKIQDSGAVALRVEKTGELEGLVMTLRSQSGQGLEDDFLFVRTTLGLDPTADQFRVVYGSVARDDREIAILSRSMLEIIIDLGSYIDVPSTDVEQRRVNATMPAGDAPGGRSVPPLIGIRSSPQHPQDSFVAIPYRDHWFWIDDRDLRSKSLFSFLMFMFALNETEGKEGAPIVTIPAG